MTDIETYLSVTLIIRIAQANTKMLKWRNFSSKPASWAPANEENVGRISTVLGGLFGE